jgi:hypothetical protein
VLEQQRVLAALWTRTWAAYQMQAPKPAPRRVDGCGAKFAARAKSPLLAYLLPGHALGRLDDKRATDRIAHCRPKHAISRSPALKLKLVHQGVRDEPFETEVDV